MKKFLFAALASAMLMSALFGCAGKDVPSPRNPVTLTIWHTYVENMRYAFDELVAEYNATEGAQSGITVKVTSITDAKVINEHLIAAANNDPGAPEMPDMAVVYPQAAITLAEKGALYDLTESFTQEELDAYVPQFIDEGRLGTEALYLLPVAKSTEVLYVNSTFFEPFSRATGIGLESLATFEGIAETAIAYYEWTDAKTPDIPGDGKQFYYPEVLFNQAMIGLEQLGAGFVRADSLAVDDPVFSKIWDAYYPPAVRGGTAIYDGWGNYLATTGEIVCALQTSAGAAFYPTGITYPDNTKEEVYFEALPYPVYEGGEKVAFQRGGGVCVMKSEPAQELAASMFLKWFTQPDRNLRFCAATGYMPVRRASFDAIVAGDLPAMENHLVERTLRTVAEMQRSYRFYYPPVFDGFDALQAEYARQLRGIAQTGREAYLSLSESLEAEEAFSRASDGAAEEFARHMRAAAGL